MMHGQIAPNLSSTLAGMMISNPGKTTLRFPVLAFVLKMTAAPSRIVGSAPSWRRTPSAEANSAAKVVLDDGIRLFLEWFTAGVTDDRFHTCIVR